MGGTDGRTDGEKRGWGGRGMGAAMGMEADLGSLRPAVGSSLPPPPPQEANGAALIKINPLFFSRAQQAARAAAKRSSLIN